MALGRTRMMRAPGFFDVWTGAQGATAGRVPQGYAHWSGQMLGFQWGYDLPFVEGVASVDYDLSTNLIDVLFSEVASRDGARRLFDFGFNSGNIRLDTDGTFEGHGGNDILNGAFVGPDGEEVVGTFNHAAAGVIGSFGAHAVDETTIPVVETQPARPGGGDGEIIDLSQFLAPAIEQGTAPGMVAAVIGREGVRAIGAAGVRRQGSPELITGDDLVHIGSETKAMTSTMLATLVEDGSFVNGWDTTIADVFPELASSIHEDYHSVTLSQLVRMRGGIARDAVNWWMHSDIPDIMGRRYTLLKENLAVSPEGSAGEYSYSNLSYMIAGAMAERRTGKSWETLMEERLFAPLGIADFGFGAPGTPGRVDQPWGHKPADDSGWAPEQYDNPPALGPAGTVHISIEDWAKFISLWFIDRGL